MVSGPDGVMVVAAGDRTLSPPGGMGSSSRKALPEDGVGWWGGQGPPPWLLLHALVIVLEAVYEPTFSPSSYAQGPSPHPAVPTAGDRDYAPLADPPLVLLPSCG